MKQQVSKPGPVHKGDSQNNSTPRNNGVRADMADVKVLEDTYRHPGLSPEDLEIIRNLHQKIVIPKGYHFIREGEPSSEYHVLISGLIRSYVYDFKMNEITTGFFGKGEIVIEVVSLFERTPSKENIHAVTDCVCWRIDYENFQRLFHSNDAFSEWGRTWMTRCFFQLKQRTVSMITDTASDRYLALRKQYPEILLQAPLKYIATYLGITDTSLSRIRRKLSRKS